MAILGTLAELLPRAGADRHLERLRPLTRDYDPRVAEAAAELVSTLSGWTTHALPEPLPPLPTPTARELEALSRQSVVLEMARGGDIEIRLRPDLAATNAHGFASLVRAGYYDGLTFHRVEPNFVLQGGSPGANEYAGHPRYTRDELSDHGHWAGTVGLSTRGRDTGDLQIFINLVDNNRLDGQYTVLGEVVRGMEVVLGVLEGDVIRRATVRER
jgi:cyclophilin family peptidyl-prolyl cis-trans isomerase